MEKKTVLFVCSFNSVRSQIAEGLLNARCYEQYTAYSAGIAPAGLNPYAVAVMRESRNRHFLPAIKETEPLCRDPV